MLRLELDRVGKRYGDQPVLRDVSLRVAPGEIVLLRGPSGAGKTTLLQVAGLLEPPTEGRVLLDGEDATRLDPEARASLRLHRLGHVFQTHNMIPSMSLLENVLLPMRLARRGDRARAAELLDRVGLADRVDALPNEVSVGQRQRAAFARALANEPDILLADEPTASLDDENAERVTDILLDQAARGCAVVLASHDARVQARLGERAQTWHSEGGRLTRVA